MISGPGARVESAAFPHPSAGGVQAARRSSVAAPGYSPGLGSLGGCVKAAATFYLLMLPGGADAAASRQATGRATGSPRLQKVAERFVAHGGRDIMMLEAHDRPDNPLVFTQLGLGAVAGTKEDTEIWFEMNVEEGTDTSIYEGSPRTPRQKDALLDALDFMMPSTEKLLPSFSGGLMELVNSPRTSFKVVNWASESPDPARFLESEKKKLVNIGHTHGLGVSIAPDHVHVKPGWADVPPSPLSQRSLLKLSPGARANMFSLFERSSALRKTMMVITDDGLSADFDLSRVRKSTLVETFTKECNRHGHPVMLLPLTKGYKAVVVLPLEDLATMRELADEDPQIRIFWNDTASQPPRTDL